MDEKKGEKEVIYTPAINSNDTNMGENDEKVIREEDTGDKLPHIKKLNVPNDDY